MKRFGLLFVALGLMIIGNSDISACVCTIAPTDDKEIKKAIIAGFNNVPLVFSGTVIAVEYIPVIKRDRWGKEIKAEALVYRFLVNKLWKGKSKGEVVLHTDVYKYDNTTTSSSCDFNFKIGEQYLVYAITDLEGKLKRHGCSRTNNIKNSKRDIVEIKKLINRTKHR